MSQWNSTTAHVERHEVFSSLPHTHWSIQYSIALSYSMLYLTPIDSASFFFSFKTHVLHHSIDLPTTHHDFWHVSHIPATSINYCHFDIHKFIYAATCSLTTLIYNITRSQHHLFFSRLCFINSQLPTTPTHTSLLTWLDLMADELWCIPLADYNPKKLSDSHKLHTVTRYLTHSVTGTSYTLVCIPAHQSGIWWWWWWWWWWW